MLVGWGEWKKRWETLRGEAGFVDAVVDVVVGPFIRSFDLLPVLFWKEVYVLVLLGDDVVELGVEHADDLT